MRLITSATIVLLLLPLASEHLQANDIPATVQTGGSRSTIAVEDGDGFGEIGDAELMDFICDQLVAQGKKVKDVKMMVNACFGGGMLDDLQRIFGPGGQCEGIPWVGGAASSGDESAWGHGDKRVDDNLENRLGSMWTDALAGDSPFSKNQQAGVLRDGSITNNVLQDLQQTAQNDYVGPSGLAMESPQVASGNGGHQIMWNSEGTKHEAVVFGGAQTNLRHSHNVQNVKQALEEVWHDSDHTIQDLDGGTADELKDALAAAIARLDENTQLVIYLDDHGGSALDLEEAAKALGDVLLKDTDIEDPSSFNFDLPRGWFKALFGNYFSSTPQTPMPHLQLDLETCEYCSSWGFNLNFVPFEFPPGGDRTGPVNLPIPFWAIDPGRNLVEIIPRMPAGTQSRAGKQNHAGKMRTGKFDLSLGPINELELSELKTGQSAAYYNPNRNGEGLFIELLEGNLAVVYMFTYNKAGDGQAWMVGVGEQIGEGIVVEEMFMPVGAKFGEDFDPADVDRQPFGSLAFHLPQCGSTEPVGSLFFYPTGQQFYSNLFSSEYTQLTSLFDCDTEAGDPNGPYSGSWYDLSHDGEGIILEVLSNGIALVQWFTYDSEGNQMWIQGTGTFNGNVLTVDSLYTAEGTRWGSQFNPDDIVLPTWGSLTMEFTTCGAAKLSYNSTVGFGNGMLDMVRLTNLMGITCTD